MKCAFSRIVILAVMLVACSIPALSSAKIEFDKEKIDLGSVKVGDPMIVDFKFKNAGDADLNIVSVHAGCGCMQASAMDLKIAPGKSSAVEASFKSDGYSGEVERVIYVRSNDPDCPVVVLKISVNIITLAKIMPERINFGTLKTNSTCTKTLELIPVDPKNFMVTKVTSTGTAVSASKFKRIEDNDGVRWVIYLQIKPGANVGRVFENVKIETKPTDNTPLSAIVYGNVEP